MKMVGRRGLVLQLPAPEASKQDICFYSQLCVSWWSADLAVWLWTSNESWAQSKDNLFYSRRSNLMRNVKLLAAKDPLPIKKPNWRSGQFSVRRPCYFRGLCHDVNAAEKKKRRRVGKEDRELRAAYQVDKKKKQQQQRNPKNGKCPVLHPELLLAGPFSAALTYFPATSPFSDKHTHTKT